MIDTNNNQEIDFKEFKQLFKKVEIKAEEKDIEVFFRKIDVQQLDRISYDNLVVFINDSK